MAVIFLMSTSLGAGANTSRILGPLLQFFFPEIAPESIAGLRSVIRKLAHFAEYFGLAVLVWRALFRPAAEFRPWSWPIAGWSTLICVAYAASDEFHQTFVPTRAGSPFDVMIDSCGVLAAIGALWLWWHRRGGR